MTIKGPNAHNYRGGLGDLLGWGGDSRYDYADDYDVEAHRQYLYQQQQQQQQYYESNDSSSAGGFANALNNRPPQPSTRMSYNAPQSTEVQQSSQDAEAAAENKAKWDK